MRAITALRFAPRIAFATLAIASAPAHAQTATKLHGAPPEVSFVSETGNCPTIAKVDHVRPSRGSVEVQISAVDNKADATCVCKTPAPKIVLSRATTLTGQAPLSRELSFRPLESGKPATFQLKLTISPDKGRESYLLRAICGG